MKNIILSRLAFLFFVTFVVPVCGMESVPSNQLSVIGNNYEQKNEDLKKKLTDFYRDYLAVKLENERLNQKNELIHSQVMQLSEKLKQLMPVLESEKAEREKLLSENELLLQQKVALVFELEEQKRLFFLEFQRLEKEKHQLRIELLGIAFFPKKIASDPSVVSSGNEVVSKKESKASFINKKTVIVSIFLLLAAAVYACYKNQVEMSEFLKAYKAT